MADGIAARLGTALHPVSYSASDERLLQSVLAAPSAATRARPGRRAGGGLEVTVGGTPESAIIAAGGGVITDAGGGSGSFIFVIPTQVSKTLASRPAAGQSRIDEVVAKILNVDDRPVDGLNEIDIAVITGTASSGAATAPTIPSGYLRLAELVVPASGTVTVQAPGQRTVALGGILPVASQTERDAIEVIYEGLIAYREDTDVWEGRANGAWVPMRTKVDSGWVTLPSVITSGGGIRYRRVDDQVFIQVAGLFTTVSGTNYIISTALIPSALRPSPPIGNAYRFGGYFGGWAGNLYVTNTGEVHAIQNTGANRGSVDGLLAYPLN